MLVSRIRIAVFLILLLSVCSCISYYARYQRFNTDFEQGNYEDADRTLASEKRGSKNKSQLLYFLNRGVVNSYLGKYEESNDFFEQAYNISEVQTKSAVDVGLTLLLNPKVTEYRGETFEVLLINYFKAFNYLKMGKYDEALVECKRMDVRLNKLSDKFQSDAKYKRDAFIHLLMGLIYDVNQDYNNAFIAYRNALDIYENDYAKFFGTPVPEQLKKDLLRTAYLTGFMDQVDLYQKKFGIQYQSINNQGKGELLLLWHNGFGPVKQEWSLDFAVVEQGNGFYNFVNLQAGLVIPINLGGNSTQGTQIKNLQVIRMTLPRYIERPPVFTSGQATTSDGFSYPLEMVENINAIAFKSLNDRLGKELGQALLRLAIKKIAEAEVRKENKDIGIVLGLFDAISEQADTRNWQSLPYAVHYARIPLPPGNQTVQFNKQGNQGANQTIPIQVTIAEGQTYVYTLIGQ